MIVPDSITWPVPTTIRAFVIATFWADVDAGINMPTTSTTAVVSACAIEVIFMSIDDLSRQGRRTPAHSIAWRHPPQNLRDAERHHSNIHGAVAVDAYRPSELAPYSP